jgi:hypothetical protein
MRSMPTTVAPSGTRATAARGSLKLTLQYLSIAFRKRRGTRRFLLSPAPNRAVSDGATEAGCLSVAEPRHVGATRFRASDDSASL